MTDVSYYGNNPSAPKQQQQQPPPPPPQQQQQQQQSTTDQGKIFVGGLSWQTTEESLRWHFEQYGRVLSVEVMKNRVTGEPRGFAFVVFADTNTVDVVMAEDSHEINHKIVDVKRAQARGVAPPSIHQGHHHHHHHHHRHDSNNGGNNNNQTGSTSSFTHNKHRTSSPRDGNELTPEQLQNKVFVGGIPPHVDKEELREIFEQFGTVVDAIVMLDQQTNRSRGFGFVTFENGCEGAKKSVAAQPLQIHGRRVEVKLATPRAEQKRVLPAGPKHVGLRAGQSSSSSSGEFAGLAVAYGRNGWKAGYGSFAFSKAGWAVQGWEDSPVMPERSGFSFDMLTGGGGVRPEGEPAIKRARVQR